MTSTSCRRPRAAAAASSAAQVSSSLASERSKRRTVSAASSGAGARSSQIGAVMPAARCRSAFACRDSPSATAPPASIALPTSGDPQVHFVTADDLDAAERTHDVARVRGDLAEIGGECRLRAHGPPR